MPETSRTITWLHISDLHCCPPKSGWDADLVINTLVEDLKHMQNDHNLRPDFIFFTGDAAWGEIGCANGEKMVDQFEAARSFFNSVRQAFEPEVPTVNMFLVPGNHDVNRKRINEPDIDWLNNLKSLDPINERINKADNDWKRWMQRLDDYRNFLESNGYSHLVQDEDRLIYGTCRKVSGFDVGIVGFNTAWSCSRDGEKGKLWWAGKWQVGHLRQKLKETAFNIGLLHHPSNWFTEFEDPSSWLKVESLCKFILHGHEHNMWVHENVDGPTRISAAACYDRSDRENGYNFVRLNLESGEGKVWLRRFCGDTDEWGERHIPKKAPNGVWYLRHLKWLQSKSPTIRAPRESPVYQVEPTEVAGEELSGEFELLRESIISQLATYSKPTSSYLQRETFDILIANFALSFSGAQPDILMRPIEPNSVDWPEKLLHEKAPLLQELCTPEQVRDHFLPMPRVTQGLGEWLRCKHDLLFLGLPFCGKTSLLTYLAVEAARNQKTKVRPILLRPRNDLSAEAVEAAIVDLKKRLERIKAKADKRQILLLLDNVHNPVHCEIASRLMASPRQWRVWGAARSGEFARLQDSGRKSPWAEANVIRDACSLTSNCEAEWMMEQVLNPCLQTMEKGNLESQVLEAIEAAGQVPTRFLIQVWGIIKEDKADIDTGYRDLIENLPKDTDAVVQSLMPQSIPGIRALVITDYLLNPPWDLLEAVLAAVDEYGPKLADKTISQLRRMSSLVPDSEQSFRATMYDPLREAIRREENLSKAFETQIWDALLSYLKLGNDIEQAAHPTLSGFWGELTYHTMRSKQSAVLVAACSERKLIYTEGDARVEALYLLGLAKLAGDEADVAEAHRVMTEACTLADQLGEETKNAAYASVLWAYYHPAQDAETFEQRLSRLTAAERICIKLGKDIDVAYIADMTAKLLLFGANKDAAAALQHASAAVDAHKRLKNPAKLGAALVVLAQCQAPPDWEGAAKTYREALRCLTEDTSKELRGTALNCLAECQRNQTSPDWEGAINTCQEALSCLTDDTAKELRTAVLYNLGICRMSQTPPDWEAAYALSKQALELSLELALKLETVLGLENLVWLCSMCSQPPWEDVTEHCHMALGILTADEDKQQRESVRVCLAKCLHSQTPPN